MTKELKIKGTLKDIDYILPFEAKYGLKQCGEDVVIVYEDSYEKIILRYLYQNDVVTITKDNIHIYYEFMSDYDKTKYSHTVLNYIFRERERAINENLNTLYSSELSDKKFVNTKYYKTNNTTKPDILEDGKCLWWGGDSGTLEVSYFGVKDTLKPIEEYIKEIKESEQYKEYMSKKVA